MSTESPLSQPPPTWAVSKLRTLIDSPPPLPPNLLSALHTITPHTPSPHLPTTLTRLSTDSSLSTLSTLTSTQTSLTTLQSHLSAIQTSIETLSTRLSTARTSASTVIQQTSHLRAKLSDAQLRSSVSHVFLKRFVLSPSEIQALDSNHVTEPFLSALKRLEKVHEDSRILLRCHNQRAGLETLEFAATKREEAYEKVFRYVQAECGRLDVDAEEHEREAALLREGIRALRARPMLLKFCAEEVGSARRASLVARFVTALTKGGRGGVPRPIELHAHDPMRYTNDMLAWIHQALASEKELMSRLFMGGVGGGGEELALGVLNTVFDALCRPFRIRFEQALEASLPVVVLYRLASLLEFYASTMGKLLGGEAALPEMLMECHSIAMYGFFSGWKSKMEAFKMAGLSPSDDLIPPAAVNQSMTRLDEIMATLDASLTPEEARQGQIAAVLEVILNPLQSLCEGMAARALGPVEKQVFLANCIDSMRMPLIAYSFASARVEQLTALADMHVDQYIRLGTVVVLRRCGLAERARILAEAKEAVAATEDGQTTSHKTFVPLSKVAGMDVEALSISVKNFYAMLFGGSTIGCSEALQPPFVEKLTNVRARNRARAAVAESLARTHSEIYAAVQDGRNQYGPDAVAAVGLRDPQKVELILCNGQMASR
eukprot:GFKZ01015868.1.p1 GENE.GFKZ01015868.1~~GFKZ01015868.1.p1  ORF type:complete len:661 (+),score=67.63 GFKZ01015868.1:119-2101(+)